MTNSATTTIREQGYSTLARSVAEHSRPATGSRDDGHRLAGLLEAVALPHSPDDISLVLQQIVEKVAKGLGVTSVTLYLAGKDDNLLHPVATSAIEHRDQILSFPVELGAGLTGRVAGSGEGCIINHAESSSDAVQIPGTPLEPESVMAVP